MSGAAPSRADCGWRRLPALRALDLENQRGDVRGRIEQLAGPAVEQPRRFEHRLDPCAMMRDTAGHAEGHDVLARRQHGVFADRDRAGLDERAQHLLESLAREDRVSRDRQSARDRRQQRCDATSPIGSTPVHARRTCRRRTLVRETIIGPPVTQAEGVTNRDANKAEGSKAAATRRNAAIPVRFDDYRPWTLVVWVGSALELPQWTILLRA